MSNKELYNQILYGHIPDNIITSLGYTDPEQQINIGNTIIVSLNAGNNPVLKIALGSNSIWDANPNT